MGFAVADDVEAIGRAAFLQLAKGGARVGRCRQEDGGVVGEEVGEVGVAEGVRCLAQRGEVMDVNVAKCHPRVVLEEGGCGGVDLPGTDVSD